MEDLAATFLFLRLASCTSTVAGDGPSKDEPLLTFGETSDSASLDANELMSKSPSNPNPSTLVGI